MRDLKGMSMNVFRERCQQNHFEKQCIGLYVAGYLRKNALNLPVVVDGGSTNLCVLQGIYQDAREGRPTVSQVLTNHLEGIYLARDLEGVRLVLRSTGGVLRVSRATFIGGADRAIQEHEFWMAVVGANGFEPPSLQTATDSEHSVKRAMVSRARQGVIFPIDSSKWGFPAGEHLYTLDEVVSWRKRVVMVTCYPVRKEEEGESDNRFAYRVNRFLTTIATLVDQWNYSIRVFAAPVNEEEFEFADVELPSATSVAHELRGAYARTISPGQERQIGFVIRFDLWGELC